jgi:hypothetical protein
MAFAPKRNWRDWFREMFVRQGLFSLRPVPRNEAERALETSAQRPPVTRLNLTDTKKAK